MTKITQSRWFPAAFLSILLITAYLFVGDPLQMQGTTNFSALQVDGATLIDGSADAAQLTVQGHLISDGTSWYVSGQANADGGITMLRHADQEVFNVLFGLYTRWRVVVYGD